MAIRLKKEVWAMIRNEYEAGATAAELVERFKGVKAASVHARAGREKWRDVAFPLTPKTSNHVTCRAEAEGISVEEAAALEAIDQNRAVAAHRAGADLIGSLLTEGLNLAAAASKQNNAEMAKSASILISSVKNASSVLHLKMEVDRIAFDLGQRTLVARCSSESEFGGPAQAELADA